MKCCLREECPEGNTRVCLPFISCRKLCSWGLVLAKNVAKDFENSSYVGTHVLRLYGAGLFDRFPKLKLIIGHNGEDLPMFIDRIDSTGLRNDTTFDRVWNTNIWTTTSAFFTVRAFQQLRQVTSIERIMYSVDYPFSSMSDGWKFIEQLAENKVLRNDEMDMFAYKNAERLLKL
ncbi:hypothetical protein HBH98_190440 [Parastagonospora nodorum]|nr:hypothetical protein HBH98_190440 [Parastagonospora nodorum]KAH4364590.1 hypothetical protein HBH97_176510 [Parastagonospora nodorum]KAH4385482.1 hypothetical protein HBH99_175250 [Parastagonospora nodorum]KAH4897193.1 hypothetical protein HBI80_195700 [Parastagonospora nodorum]KAH4915163.1 hypothetical protein HBH74_147940 [Parastagonospora nodorum]